MSPYHLTAAGGILIAGIATQARIGILAQCSTGASSGSSVCSKPPTSIGDSAALCKTLKNSRHFQMFRYEDLSLVGEVELQHMQP